MNGYLCLLSSVLYIFHVQVFTSFVKFIFRYFIILMQLEWNFSS